MCWRGRVIASESVQIAGGREKKSLKLSSAGKQMERKRTIIITPAESLLPCKEAQSQVLRTRTYNVLGVEGSLLSCPSIYKT